MLAIPHSVEMIEKAFSRAKQMGAIGNSILEGRGSPAGFLAEEAVAAWTGAEIVSDSSYDYDLILNGETVEVKTKRRTVAPQSHYHVSIAETSRHQQPDRYIFTSVEFGRSARVGGQMRYGDIRVVWLLGQIEARRFFETATLWSSGTEDTANGFVASVDCWQLPIGDLEPVV